MLAGMSEAGALDRVARAVERFFAGPGAAWAGAPGVVAFSGGADSTALLAVLAERARRGGAAVVAAHLDHGLDAASAARAGAAAEAARRLGVDVVVERRPPAPGEHRRGGVEAAARRRRHRFLAEVARRRGAAWVATAHHRDDLAETVILRLAFGSGIEGLGGIAPVGALAPGVALLRPLLAIGREEIEAALAAAGLRWTEDPTNRDPAVPRNRVRHLLLPALAHAEGVPREALVRRLASVAERAAAASAALAGRLGGHLGLAAGDAPAPQGGVAAPPAPSVDLAALAALPPALLAPALALLHRAAGLAYPPPATARRELARQIARRIAGRVSSLSVDAGAGWRWTAEGDRLALRPAPPPPPAARGFSYTLAVPGEVELPELGLRLSIQRRPREPWMLRGERRRAALALPLAAGDRVVVRSRRPGDRLRPLGASGTRRLKDLLIDRRVPRQRRDLLPLVCVGREGAEIAWVPGVTIDHRFRLPEGGGGEPVWVAEIVPAGGIGTPGQPLVDAR